MGKVNAKSSSGFLGHQLCCRSRRPRWRVRAAKAQIMFRVSPEEVWDSPTSRHARPAYSTPPRFRGKAPFREKRWFVAGKATQQRGAGSRGGDTIPCFPLKNVLESRQHVVVRQNALPVLHRGLP